MLDPVPPRAEVPPAPRVERPVHALPRTDGLLDRRVPDRVHRYLEPREVRVVEELHQAVFPFVERPPSAVVPVGLRERRRSGPDRAVQGEVAADRLQAEIHDVGDVLVRDVRHHVDRELHAMLHEHLAAGMSLKLVE